MLNSQEHNNTNQEAIRIIIDQRAASALPSAGAHIGGMANKMADEDRPEHHEEKVLYCAICGLSSRYDTFGSQINNTLAGKLL